VHKLQMGNEQIEFSARFGGVARQISVPIDGVHALYARETGHGMTFELEPAKPAVQAERGRGACKAVPTALPAPLGPEETAGRQAAR
jgi:stringent starvation protein B